MSDLIERVARAIDPEAWEIDDLNGYSWAERRIIRERRIKSQSQATAAIRDVREFDCERGPSEAEIEAGCSGIYEWWGHDPSEGDATVAHYHGPYRHAVGAGLRAAAVERKRQWEEGE